MNRKHEIQADLIIAIQTSDIHSFKSLLNSSEIDSSTLISPTCHTIFHELSKSLIPPRDSTLFYQALISFFYSRYQENAELQIKSFLNTQENGLRMTPLHLAVSSGKITMLKEYVKAGADHKLKTKKGQNLSHLACIQGSLGILVYLKFNLNHDLLELDSSGTSCLHLAAESKNDHIALALIAWGSDVNSLDNEKNTPLHYAVGSGSYKITRYLLQAGSNTTLKNSSGLRPIDLLQHHSQRGLLYKTLRDPSCLEKFNPFKHPIKPPKHTSYLFAFFVLIYLLRYMVVLMFIVPHLESFLEVASILIFLISTISFMMVSQSNPGFLKKGKKNQSPLELYETFQPEFLCPFCMNKKPPRARHCFYCKKCVKKYDHHCPWINNCVGKGNQKLFFFFVSILSVDFLYNSIIGIIDYFEDYRMSRYKMFYTGEYYPEAALFASFLSFASFLIAFPVFLIQVTNRIKHKTTHERFSSKYHQEPHSNNTSGSSMPSMTLLKIL